MVANEVICLDSEDEDQNVTSNRPSAENLPYKPAFVPSQTRFSVSPLQHAQRPASSLGCLLRSERKQIELERLARTIHTTAGEVEQGASSLKRKMDDIDSRQVKIHKTEESDAVPASQFYTRGGSTTGSESPEVATGVQFQGSEKKKLIEPKPLLRLGSELHPEDGLGIQFPYGAVKKTFLEEVERTGDDITIEEVLQRVSPPGISTQSGKMLNVLIF